MVSVSQWSKWLAIKGDRVLRPRPGVVILIYHRVGGGTSSSIDLDIESFRWQMEYLSENASVVTLDEALRQMSLGDAAPSVVITFDDGTNDFTDNAVPIMVETGVPSLLYAETAPITSGRKNASGLIPTSWSALSDAISTGLVSVGSHTHNHRLMRDLDASSSSAELERSIAAIHENLGAFPSHFAYPKAVDGNPAANLEVRRRFRSAALGGGRANVPGCDPYRLSRTPIQRADDRSKFISKIRGGMRLEGILREQVGRRRYRSATY